MTMNVSGTASNNPAIYGSGDNAQTLPPGPADGTGINIYGATNVTIDHNTIIGAKTDIGIAVVAQHRHRDQLQQCDPQRPPHTGSHRDRDQGQSPD